MIKGSFYPKYKGNDGRWNLETLRGKKEKGKEQNMCIFSSVEFPKLCFTAEEKI